MRYFHTWTVPGGHNSHFMGKLVHGWLVDTFFTCPTWIPTSMTSLAPTRGAWGHVDVHTDVVFLLPARKALEHVPIRPQKQHVSGFKISAAP